MPFFAFAYHISISFFVAFLWLILTPRIERTSSLRYILYCPLIDVGFYLHWGIYLSVYYGHHALKANSNMNLTFTMQVEVLSNCMSKYDLATKDNFAKILMCNHNSAKSEMHSNYAFIFLLNNCNHLRVVSWKGSSNGFYDKKHL